MQIRFLGTGDAFCSGGRFQTCFLVETSHYNFLMDCGATSLLALNAANIDSNFIDAIVITHFHGDHYGGLPFVLLDANFNRQRKSPLTIVGPEGIDRRVGELMEILYPKSMGKLLFPIVFKEYKSREMVKLGPIEIESFPVVHVPESLPHALRISLKEKVLSFSGDTGWTDSLYQVSDDADLFICECNFFETPTPSHLDYQTIASKVDKLNCKKIVLNHLGPEMLENLNKIDLECSYDGMILEI